MFNFLGTVFAGLLYGAGLLVALSIYVGVLYYLHFVSGYSALASFGFVVVFWLLGSLVAALRKRGA